MAALRWRALRARWTIATRICGGKIVQIIVDSSRSLLALASSRLAGLAVRGDLVPERGSAGAPGALGTLFRFGARHLPRVGGFGCQRFGRLQGQDGAQPLVRNVHDDRRDREL